MNYDPDKVDEMVLPMLALLWLTATPEGRSWKGYDWDALDRLHAKGYTSTPRARPNRWFLARKVRSGLASCLSATLAALENEGLLLATSVYGASFAICASSSASVRRSSSEYRSLLLSSSCWRIRLRDSKRSAFLLSRSNSSCVSCARLLPVSAACDSICASTDLLSHPLAIRRL